MLLAIDAGNTNCVFALVEGGEIKTRWRIATDPRRSAAASQVVAAFRAAGVEPEGLTLPAYAAVELWAQAARAAKSTERDAVAKAIDTGRFPTVLGEVSCNARGDATLPGFAVWQWKGGRIDALAP